MHKPYNPYQSSNNYTIFAPGSHTLPWIYQVHENRQQTAFQPTCLNKSSLSNLHVSTNQVFPTYMSQQIKPSAPHLWQCLDVQEPVGHSGLLSFEVFFCFFVLCQSGVHSSWHTGHFCSLWHTVHYQLLRDFSVMHKVLQLLMWYFLPVIWLLNLIVACHHFFGSIYVVCCYITFIVAGVCWGRGVAAHFYQLDHTVEDLQVRGIKKVHRSSTKWRTERASILAMQCSLKFCCFGNKWKSIISSKWCAIFVWVAMLHGNMLLPFSSW